MVWELIYPLLGYQDSVKAFERRPVTLIGPGVDASLQIKVLKLIVIDELSKTAHHASVYSIVVFVCGLINEVAVTTN